jgi:hypothetical protein
MTCVSVERRVESRLGEVQQGLGGAGVWMGEIGGDEGGGVAGGDGEGRMG